LSRARQPALVIDLASRRRPPAERIVARCSCGRAFTGAEWLGLSFVGIQRGYGGAPDIEVRLCLCGSSRSIDAALAAKLGSGPAMRHQGWGWRAWRQLSKWAGVWR
jgi:hypothetical protein